MPILLKNVIKMMKPVNTVDEPGQYENFYHFVLDSLDIDESDIQNHQILIECESSDSHFCSCLLSISLTSKKWEELGVLAFSLSIDRKIFSEIVIEQV